MKESGLEFKMDEFLEFGGVALKVSKMRLLIFVILSGYCISVTPLVILVGALDLITSSYALMRGYVKQQQYLQYMA